MICLTHYTSLSPAAPSTYPSSAEYLVRQITQHKTGVTIAVVLGIAVLAGLAFIGYKFGWRKQTAPSFAAMKIEKLTDTGKAGSVAISPDGKMVVHVMD